MPEQKRQHPSPSSKPRDHVEANGADASTAGGGGGGLHLAPGGGAANRVTDPQAQPKRVGDSGSPKPGGGASSDSESSQSDGGMDEFILVKLAEIRKEVQCPICLALLAMLLICLRLQELAFSEEEKTRNKKIQETIEETVRKQSEAMGKKSSTAKATANAFARKYRRNVRTRGRGRTVARDIVPAVSDNEDREEVNANDASKESSSADNHSPDLKQKRGRKRPAPLPSPVRTITTSDHGSEENDELVSVKENFTTSPLRGEMLAWGKNGTRSQTRYGNVGGLNGRLGKSGRVAKLVEHIRTTDEMDKEFNLYLVLLPLDGQTTPKLEKPYLSCQPTVSIRHLVQLIALQLCREVEELEIYIRMDLHRTGVATDSSSAETKLRLLDGLERLREDKLLSDLHPSFASGRNDLELLYALKAQD
ncbi:hypothetical protein ACQ4PT_008064 [Festuca glaucescens]